MDALDVRMLRAIGTRPFAEQPRNPDMARPTVLARKLGIHRNTVRARLRALQKSGVVAQFQAYPNLRLLGLRLATVHLEVDPATKPTAVAQLGFAGGVCRWMDFMGRHLGFDLHYSSEGEKERRLGSACQVLRASAHILEDRRMPPAPREPSPLDWKIIRTLRGNGMRPLPSIARELDVAPRTIRRRYEAMVEQGILDIVPLVDLARIPSGMPLLMLFHFDPTRAADAMREVLEGFDDRNLFAHVPADARLGQLAMQAYATSAAEVEQMRRRAMAMPGVARAQILVGTDVQANESWLEEAIDRRAAGLGDLRPDVEPLTP